MKKKRILVFGMYEKFGGIETFIYNIVSNSNPNQIHFDFFVITGEKDGQNPYIDRIKKFYDGNVRFYSITKFKKNPLKALMQSIEVYKCCRGKYDAIYCNCAEVNIPASVSLLSGHRKP